MVGHNFIREEFGDKAAQGVKIGFQLDEFGHSNTNAKIYSNMGYEAMFFARMDFQDQSIRA